MNGPSEREQSSPAGPSVRDALVGTIPNLRAFAISLTGDHSMANDLVQETLLKAWASRDKYQAGTNLKAWLFTILRNTYFSQFRKSRRETQDVDGAAAARLVSLPEQLGHLDMADFKRALELLPVDQRESLLLVGAEGFSYEEAAEIAGCAVGTVKSRVNRARVRLAELLAITPPRDLPARPATHVTHAQPG
ncbi:MAG: sigma-70 family RNA polymerase sigma factor [Vicinamibacterales bacterium]